MIQLFTMQDYDNVYQLWQRTPGVGLRSLDDSWEGIERFLKRNPITNFIAVEDNQVVGVILSGHDGRRGYLYHTCVDENYRLKAIGRHLVEHVIEAMRAENITKLGLVCFSENVIGNNFWNSQGWEKREDLNYYTVSINSENK